MSKTIPLTQGKNAIVDNHDYDFLMRWKWFFARDRKGGYASRNSREKPRKTIRMHRVIAERAGLDVLGEIDHKDQDKLNNRRHNLRPANQQNQRNTGLRRDNTSGFKGASFYRQTGQWQAQIMVEGKSLCLGYFDTAKEAAHAYDVAALKYFGEFAALNFPREIHPSHLTGANHV